MRRSLGLVAMAVVAAVSPASAANAPVADKPIPKVGDVFEYQKRFVSIDCARWEVKAVGQDGYDVLQCGDNLAYINAGSGTLTRIVAGNKPLFEYKPYLPTLSFPLELSKKWEGKYEGFRADQSASWKSDVACEVKAFETVKVQAGEFEAYRIACADNWESMGFHGTADSTFWYAPKIGVVKYVSAADSTFDYELAAYHVK